MIPRVFVVEPYKRPGIDITDLNEFGEVVYLFPLNGDRTSIFDEEFGFDVLEKLDTYRFDPSTDFIAIVGPMVNVVLMIAAAVQEHSPLNVLAYNRCDSKYTTLTLGNLTDASSNSIRKN